MSFRETLVTGIVLVLAVMVFLEKLNQETSTNKQRSILESLSIIFAGPHLPWDVDCHSDMLER